MRAVASRDGLFAFEPEGDKVQGDGSEVQWLQLSWFCYAAFQWWVGRAQSLGTSLGEMAGIVIWGVEKGAQL